MTMGRHADACHAPMSRRRFLQFLTHPGKPARDRLSPVSRAGSMGGLIVRGQCHACAACVRICRNGALRMVNGDQDYRLLFDPGRCTACGLCLTACLSGCLAALPADSPPQAGAAVCLAHGPLHTCRRCRSRTAALSEGGYCPICARTVGLAI